jgi:hypothetical protein
LKDFNYDFENERRFKEQQEKLQKQQEKDIIEYNQKIIQQKELAEIEKMKQQKL